MSLIALAAVAATFNLHCTGVHTQSQVKGPFQLETVKEEPFSVVYRIDLEAGRWCAGPCQATEPLAGLGDGQIAIERSDDSTDTLTMDSQTIVNRETGDYLSRFRFMAADLSSGTVDLKKGHCAREPFSGFPAKLF